MSEDNSEFFADSEKMASVNEDGVRVLAMRRDEYVKNESVIEELEIKVKDLKARNRFIEMNEIPEIMGAMAITSFELNSGEKVEVKEIVEISIPADKKELGLNWLKNNGFEDLIKTAVTMNFGRSAEDREMADRVAEYLSEQSIPFERGETVHYQTLKAWGKEQVGAGRTPPDDVFAVFIGRQAKFSVPKKGKK